MKWQGDKQKNHVMEGFRAEGGPCEVKKFQKRLCDGRFSRQRGPKGAKGRPKEAKRELKRRQRGPVCYSKREPHRSDRGRAK